MTKRIRTAISAGPGRAAVVAGVLLGILSACVSGPGRKRADAPPVLVIGIDGLEWNVLIPLLKAGRLPSFASLMKDGRYGKLATLVPTLSPNIWTSIATGKRPDKHGITGFVHESPDGTMTLLSSRDRKTKALWDIASDYRRTVEVIGWWMTYPADPVNGVMVSQTNSMIDVKSMDRTWAGSLIEGVHNQVFPPSREAEMLRILAEADRDLPALAETIFGHPRLSLSALTSRFRENSLWAIRADETYRRIALSLCAGKKISDLRLVYFEGTDVVSHRFWRYMFPGLYDHKPDPEEIGAFGHVIDDYYVHVDGIVGQLRKCSGPRTVIVVVSDHGIHGVKLKGYFGAESGMADYNSANHMDGTPGVLIIAGPGIKKAPGNPDPARLKKSALEEIGGVLDIAPTILALMRIPLGLDMDGKVLTDLFLESARIDRQPTPVATHDTPEFIRKREEPLPPDPGRDERLKQLRSLGYIR
jgi:hypothetical protein